MFLYWCIIYPLKMFMHYIEHIIRYYERIKNISYYLIVLINSFITSLWWIRVMNLYKSLNISFIYVLRDILYKTINYT